MLGWRPNGGFQHGSRSVAPRGFRAQFLLRILHVDDPLLIAAAGMFFAVSVDTLALAALFAALAVGQNGMVEVLIAAFAFTSGMTVVDGINGILFTTLVRRTERARMASRVVTAAVGGLSLLLGTGILIGLVQPSLATWVTNNSLWLGVAIAGVTSLCVWMVRSRA